MGLRFSFYLVIMSYLQWWEISHSQMAHNSCHYLIVFIGECWRVDMTLNHILFAICVWLCKGKSGYCITAWRRGLQDQRCPSKNKSSNKRFFLMSLSQDWWFNLFWLTHYINNTPPFLSDKKADQVLRLRNILSSCEAIWKMDEWLIDVGFSLTP